MKNRTFILYVKNFIFGAEDSLVSTVGLLTGITSAGMRGRDVVVSGLVLIFVEAFSMSVGSFLSERTIEESESNFERKNSKSIAGAAIMFASYLISGLIPLFPYLVTRSTRAFGWSIISSVIALFILGFVSARILKTGIARSVLRMVAIGGLAIALGVLVGAIFR